MKNLIVATAILLSFEANAQTDTSQGLLDEVIVTANKLEQKQHETAKVMTVITRSQLEQNSGQSLTEILNRQMGVIVNGNANNKGTNQSVYIRGASPGNTLILVDGVPMYDAAAIGSEFDLNHFNPSQVERVEILKGAQSTLYGSDAVAGVINILTRKSGLKKAEGYVHTSGGSFGSFNGAAGMQGQLNKWQYTAGYSYFRTDGFSSAYDSTGKNNFDNDPFSQHTFQTSIGFKPIQKLHLRAYGYASKYKGNVDASAFTDDNDFSIQNTNHQIGIDGKWTLSKSNFFFKYQYSSLNREFEDDSADIGGFAKYQQGMYNSKTHFAESYSSITITKNLQILSGIDFRYFNTDQYYLSESSFGSYETKLGDSASAKQSSLYTLILLNNLSGFNIEAGGRLNHHSIYGWNSTYSFTPSFNIHPDIKLFASLASAFKTPSLYQLYSEFGNKNLEPEKSVSIEGGIQYAHNRFSARAVYFNRNIRDAFRFYTDFSTFISYYINADKQRDQGVEMDLSWQPVSKLAVHANYTYLNGKITTSSDATGKDTAYFNLYRRPKNVMNVSLDWQALNKVKLSASLRTVSKYFEQQYAISPITLKGYYTVNLYVEYKALNKLRFFIDAQNITDQQYFDIPGYNSKGFNFMAGARLLW